MSKGFPFSGMLVLALVTSAWGNVLAAAFCPRVLGHECCFAKTHTPSSRSVDEDMAMNDLHMKGMAMEGMDMPGVTMDASSMDHSAMNDIAIEAATIDTSLVWPTPVSPNKAEANTFEQPVEFCAHCLGHSGMFNSPLSFVSVSDPSGKEIGSVLLPVSRFLIRPATAPAQIGLPREHAPPDMSAPRHILISVFQI